MGLSLYGGPSTGCVWPAKLFFAAAGVLSSSAVAFEAQTWTYNASLWWAPHFGISRRHGPRLKMVAALFTELTYGIVDIIKAQCVAHTSVCPEVGDCYLVGLSAALVSLHGRFQQGLEDLLLVQLLDDAGIHRVVADIQRATSDLAAVTHCEDLAAVLAQAATMVPCVNLVTEVLYCSRGISDIARATMPELHATQIAILADNPSSADVEIGVPRPSATTFDPSFGLTRAEILTSFLQKAQSLANSHSNQLNSVLAAEIGVDDGRTSEALLAGMPSLRLLLVDPYEFADTGYFSREPRRSAETAAPMVDALWNRVRPFRDRAIIACQRSVDAAAWVANSSLDLVFIDADHGYEAVREDIRVWRPKVRNGGVLAGHDYTLFWPGLVRAVHEFAHETRSALFLGPDHTWWIRV